jgi:hypothetical protein
MTDTLTFPTSGKEACEVVEGETVLTVSAEQAAKMVMPKRANIPVFMPPSLYNTIS